MSYICYRCKKNVFFAERKSSLGKEWHRNCLTCEECGKVLNPGQHAAHNGMPYCDNPCYKALFGPKITGFGIKSYAHTGFGPQEKWKKPTVYKTLQKQDILEKLEKYNESCQGSLDRVQSQEMNGRVFLQGRLHVYWRVGREIQLLDSDDSRLSRCSGHYLSSRPLSQTSSVSDDLNGSPPSKNSTLPANFDSQQAKAMVTSSSPVLRGPAEGEEDNVVMRTGSQQVHFYRRSINGHRFEGPSQITITPDTKTAIRVTNEDNTNSVIEILLQKFKVDECYSDFGLFFITKNGFERRLMPEEIPLLEKLSAGPQDENAKFVLKEKNANAHLSEGVRDLMALPHEMLAQMIDRLAKEEAEEECAIRKKYDSERQRILAYLTKKESVV